MQHQSHVAVVLWDLANAFGSVDQDRPDRGDKDHENRRWLVFLEQHQGDRYPGQGCDHAQKLEEGIKGAIERFVQPHGDARSNANQGSEGVADAHAGEAAHGVQKQAFIEAAAIKEGIEQQFAGAFIGPQAQGAAEFGEAEAGAELPEEQKSADPEDGGEDFLAVALPPLAKAEAGAGGAGHGQRSCREEREREKNG